MNSAISQFCYKSIVISLLFSATVAQADIAAMSQVLHQNATSHAFQMCYGGGCNVVQATSLDDDDWVSILEAFEPMPENAAQERIAIANALGKMEQIIGAKTGTSADKGGTFGNSHYPNQLDCNDEATNSTIYMRLMRDEGYLHFHQIMDTKTRGFFLNGWPHSTAVIRDNDTSVLFAVDSWFYDNGEPAVIIPFALWKSGWKPEKTSAH